MSSVNLSSKSKRLIIYFFISFIAIFGTYFLINNFNRKIEVTPEDIAKSSENAFFVPPAVNKQGQVIAGKITSSSIPTNPKVKYELQNEKRERVAYLYSDNNDLELSLGLTVELQTENSGEKYSGIDIVNVKAIKLK